MKIEWNNNSRGREASGLILAQNVSNMLRENGSDTKSNILAATLAVVVCLFFCETASAGADRFYIDSVEAVPGDTVRVNFYIENSVPITAMSFPIGYDPALLSLAAINFDSSIAAYIANKPIDSIDGHFVVGFIVISEGALQPGDGIIFSAEFVIVDTAIPGSIIIVDSLFFPPGGELLFVEENTSQIIYPAFKAGKVLVGQPNRAPLFDHITDLSTSEGDSVNVSVRAVDGDGDSVSIALVSGPLGIAVSDQGDGTAIVHWKPEFVGPTSSVGSPFQVTVSASDDELSSQISFLVNVNNVNRPPSISVVGLVMLEAGDTLSLPVVAIDPDFESIEWTLSGLPFGASFDGKNPGTLTWSTTSGDSGLYQIQFIASDTAGGADSAQVQVTVLAETSYSMRLDTVGGLPGQLVDFNLYIDNARPVSSFEMLISYESVSLTIEEFTKVGTRAESFEKFEVTYDDGGNPGHVRVVAVADETGGAVTPPMNPGSGPVAKIAFRIDANIALGGFALPVLFKFTGAAGSKDNTLTDSIGGLVDSSGINYYNGLVRVGSVGSISRGDINLNNIAYEIGDAILFTNHFMNPILYSFIPLQLANSDINEDGFAATVADLVALINIITGGKTFGKVAQTVDPTAGVELVRDDNQITIIYDASFVPGGLFVELRSEKMIDPVDIVNAQEQMDLSYTIDGDRIRLLWYSMSGRRMKAGQQTAVTIATDGNNEFEIYASDMATADGEMVRLSLNSNDQTLPERFVLYQNYPNPFNPETTIEFDVVRPGWASMVIFNMLGHEIRRFGYSDLSAGHHSIVWNGHDESGRQVASGIYLYRLQTNDGSVTRMMMLLK